MGQELVECTDYFKDTPFRVFQAPYVGAVVMPGGASQPRKQLDAWQEWAKQRGARGPRLRAGPGGRRARPARSPKNITDEEKAGIAAHVGAQPGDCIFFARRAGQDAAARCSAPPGSRSAAAAASSTRSAWSFVWVVDAPLFEPAAEATAAGDVAVGAGAWTAVHHAFTCPKDLETFDKDPGNALAWAYDIVCNGNEIGGGSIRIHRERRPEAGLRADGPRRGRGAGEVRLPARRLQVRRPAARRHRVRLGPDLRAAQPAPTRSAT